MGQLKTIKIKGKDYVEVNERLRYFRNNYPNHALVSTITHMDFGIGIDSSVASANEVDKAIKKQSSKVKMTIEIYQAMMKSISDGNKDLVTDHMGKYDMTKAQSEGIKKAINETA